MSSHESNVYELLDILRDLAVAQALTCRDADIVAGLIAEYSGDHAAGLFLAHHALADEPGDDHYADPLFATLDREFDQVDLFGETENDGAVVPIVAAQSIALVYPVDRLGRYRVAVYEDCDAFDGMPYLVQNAFTPDQVVDIIRQIEGVAA